MDMRTNLATQTYATARNAAAPQPGTGQNQENGFIAAAEDFASVLATGEETARAAMMGGADPHALVQALAASETAVETVVTVRDKVVEAYQEILRMPV
ncbi:MAG: flagellar hook-basal body complex protein FliE [Gemmobacter sp.]|uniref:flagellar hook-basal body complex protein FliE n=1 Tax=Gemmobacter sp. TaxID=1898957 RepID=UPI001A61C06D|nr:flagellar hook-basal body complex protein FliE [Gemmobacter sp.]MBL8561440.1 flagellar hook-basal body complex protein FliE [Gemmobacter sp.]